MGLARHPRNESLYGPGHGKYMAPTRQGGLGQQPVQIASALIFLSSKRIGSYVEVGFCQGWTLALMTAYLQRFAPPGAPFKSVGIDVQFNNLHEHTRAPLTALGVNVQERLPPGRHAASIVASSEPTIDLCFIDAAHNYGTSANHGVLHDYKEFAPYCKIAMFHDGARLPLPHATLRHSKTPPRGRARAPGPSLCTSLPGYPAAVHTETEGRVHCFRTVVDYDVGKAFADGGVSRFWADLKANTPSERVFEFIQQPGIYPSTLGIGIVLPADGTLHRQPQVPYPWRVRSTSPWMYTHTSMHVPGSR